MNVIGLTGANMRAMADVAELLLHAINGCPHAVAIMLYVDCPLQVRAMRANSLGITEIWRVGPDPERASLDPMVDAFIDDGAALALDVTGQLSRFLHHVALGRAVTPAPTIN